MLFKETSILNLQTKEHSHGKLQDKSRNTLEIPISQEAVLSPCVAFLLLMM